MKTKPIIFETKFLHPDEFETKREIHPPVSVFHYHNAWKWTVTVIALAALPVVMTVTLICSICYCIFKRITPKELIGRVLDVPSHGINYALLEKINKEIPPTDLVSISCGNKILAGVILIDANFTDWMIYFNGIGGSYQTNYESLKQMHLLLRVNVLCANYQRNCRSSKDAIENGNAIVNYLINDMKVDSAHIRLYGHSLGGGIAAKVARKYPKIHLISDRSFASLDLAIRELFWIPVYNHLLAKLAARSWKLNAYKAIKKLEGRVTLIVAPQDYIIDIHNASVYSAFLRDGNKLPPTCILTVSNLNNYSLRARRHILIEIHKKDLPEICFTDFSLTLFRLPKENAVTKI